MEIVSTNPLVNLTLEELNLFKLAIYKNFQVTTIEGEIKEDLKTRWSYLYNDCLQYSYLNHLTITKGYPKTEEITYGDIVQIMINKEIEKL
jgi:N-acetylneuraminic acid mutarotase